MLITPTNLTVFFTALVGTYRAAYANAPQWLGRIGRQMWQPWRKRKHP